MIRRGSREPCGLKLELGGLSNQNGVSRLARALWIEITTKTSYPFSERSRLARALWIEIINSSGTSIRKSVEARESLMDLNFTGGIYFFIDLVNKIA